MSRRYDQRTTTFTPDGRLQQIEYAVQAINKTGSSIGSSFFTQVLLHEKESFLPQKSIRLLSSLKKARSQKRYTLSIVIFIVLSQDYQLTLITSSIFYDNMLKYILFESEPQIKVQIKHPYRRNCCLYLRHQAVLYSDRRFKTIWSSLPIRRIR